MGGGGGGGGGGEACYSPLLCREWEEGLSGSLLLFSSFLDNTMECFVHGSDVLNKRASFTLYVLSEHTLLPGLLFSIGHHT